MRTKHQAIDTVMLFDCIGNSPLVWRHVEAVHLDFLFAHSCLYFNIAVVLGSVTLKAVYVKARMV